jgi:glycosyltransferase involved in cell wall biosynthesis
MKILLCHNHYQQPGGEDLSFAAEAALLEAHGHDVVRHTLHNDALAEMHSLQAAARTIWGRESYRAVRGIMRRERPDVMHCTNTFPLLSPSIYYAARAEGVPVVQSLRNYRLLCPNAYLLRDNAVCEDCLGRLFAWPGIVHGCYRESRAASAVVAGMSGVHRLLGTWRKAIDLYFTPTEFARRQFIRAGFPAEKIAVKPNFVDPDPSVGDGAGGYAIFVGRLSPEKGIATLLEAWRQLGDAVPLKIVGDGPLANDVAAAAQCNPSIEWRGACSHAEVLRLLGDARCLVMPSIWYETFGRNIVEAFAKGTPAVASRLGCMEELVEDDVTGFHFTPGDAADLARVVRRAMNEPLTQTEMRIAARAAYESRYTGEVNYRMLMDLYQRALNGAGKPRTPEAGRSSDIIDAGRTTRWPKSADPAHAAQLHTTDPEMAADRPSDVPVLT